MSRVGVEPITIPEGVEVNVSDGNYVKVKGPKGELAEKLPKEMQIIKEDGQIRVERPSNQRKFRSLHGLTRALLNNMVTGVSRGFSKALELVGVGYRAQMKGNDLMLTVGYSQPVVVKVPKEIEIELPTGNKIIVKGIDKKLVGEYAARIRKVKPPEPYKGKGIRYEDERVKRKEGKTGAAVT